jgi:hypothetical protein
MLHTAGLAGILCLMQTSPRWLAIQIRLAARGELNCAAAAALGESVS